MNDSFLSQAIILFDEWHNSLFRIDEDGDYYCTNHKMERKVRRIRDMLRSMQS